MEVGADFAWLEENVFASSPMLFPPFVFTLEAYTAAVALALSRSVPIEVDGDWQPTLLPILDLVNHSPKPTVAVRLKAARAGVFGAGASDAQVELVALEDVEAGGALSLRYAGGAVGAELLVDQGFIESSIPTRAQLTFSLDETDANYYEKVDVLENAGLAAYQSWVVSAEEEGLPDDLLAFLRLKQIKGADCFLLESVLLDALWPIHLPLPVSEENERDALREAGNALDAALAKLTGSVQQDLQSLAEAESASREYVLASVRYAERRALESAAGWIEARLMRLKNLEYYQERRLLSLGLQPIETEEELDALKAGGRAYSDVDW